MKKLHFRKLAKTTVETATETSKSALEAPLTDSPCELSTRSLIAAQIIGAAVAYLFFDESHEEIRLALVVALVLGCTGPVKHGLEQGLEIAAKAANKVCSSKALLLMVHFCAVSVAAFLGVCFYHIAQTQLA